MQWYFNLFLLIFILGFGISDAYYCKECAMQEKDRDGCPKIVNVGSAKTDRFYEKKKVLFFYKLSIKI